MTESFNRKVAMHMARAAPQAVALGLQVVELEPGMATLRLPYRPDLVGDPDTGVIAGGVVTTLLDHVCGQAVIMSQTTTSPVATLDLRIDYMRAAEPGLDITATARCYKMTHSVAFVRATAYDRDADDPVATAQAAFMLSRPPAPKSDAAPSSPEAGGAA